MKLYRLLALLLLVCLLPRGANGQMGNTWLDSTGRHWQADERGLAYYEVELHCVVHRVYANPVQYNMVRRIEEHLQATGLPQPCPVPVIDRRHFAPYPCGSNYPPGLPTHELTHSLNKVDWAAAIRNGVSGAVVRGFNGLAITEQHAGRETLEKPNNNTPSPQQPNLSALQRLVEQGVEDAVVRGFNQLSVADATVPLENLPAPARQLSATVSAQQRVESAESNLIAKHLAADPQQLLTDKRYVGFQMGSIGWYIDHDGSIRPLLTDEPLVIAQLEEGTKRADLWRNGSLLHTYVLYARYFEEAQQLKKQYY